MLGSESLSPLCHLQEAWVSPRETDRQRGGFHSKSSKYSKSKASSCSGDTWKRTTLAFTVVLTALALNRLRARGPITAPGLVWTVSP